MKNIRIGLVAALFMIIVNGCLPGSYYHPIFSKKYDISYKIRGKSLEYRQEGIYIKIQGNVVFPYEPYFNSFFTIKVENNRLDTIVIPYSSIDAYYLGRNIERKISNKDYKIIDITREPLWRVNPGSKGTIHVVFTIPSEKTRKIDRHHVITVLIGEIQEVPSGTSMRFRGDFEI